MKNFLLLLIISSLSIGLLKAQQDNSPQVEQIVVLKVGMLLKGNIELLDDKTILLSTNNGEIRIKRKDVHQTIPGDIFDTNKNVETESLVILKNKEWLKAQIFEVSERFVVLKSNGVVVSIPTSNIYKIIPLGQKNLDTVDVYKNTETNSHLDLSFDEKEDIQAKKMYNITYGAFLLNNNDDDFSGTGNTLAGTSVSHTTGYKFNPYFNVGLNVGYARYEHKNLAGGFIEGDCVFPSQFCGVGSYNTGYVNALTAGLDLRGEIMQKKIRPYYTINVGFNYALLDKNIANRISTLEKLDYEYEKSATESRLGHQFTPALGVQFKMKSMDLLVDLGYHMVNLNYDSGRLEFVDELRFRSSINNEKFAGFVLRVGILL